jgi:hypothetical protein
VRYLFQLYDEKNVLVAEHEGVTDLPPQSTIPIIDTKINVGQRSVARTLFSFSDEPTWYSVSDNYSPLRLTSQELADDGSRVSATLVNNSIEDQHRVVVTAVLFDNEGVARAASKTTLSTVARKSSVPLVFTWPSGFPNIVRAEMIILSSF